MTPPAVLTPTAQAELRQAIRALDTTAARRGLRGAVQEATRRLGTNPNLGSARLYLPRRFRVWALTRHRYLLIYDASRDPVQSCASSTWRATCRVRWRSCAIC